jgi:Family of unknown function (DUF6636)
MLKPLIALVFAVAFLVSCGGGGDEGSGRADSTGRGVIGSSVSTAPAGSSTEAEMQPNPDVVATIQTPSGNIHCDAWVYGPRDKDAEMRCFIEEISGPELPRPSTAHCDWDGGRSFEIGGREAGGRASFCDALGGRPTKPVTLDYGRAWSYGPYTCLSSLLGLLCTNASGHGVFLSRETQQPF